MRTFQYFSPVAETPHPTMLMAWSSWVLEHSLRVGVMMPEEYVWRMVASMAMLQ